MGDLTLIQQLAVWVVPVLFAITVHEVAHGWVANYYGDSTARMLGRLTLNPIKHIDPLGTILVPAVMLILPGSLIFGWAKPVPVNEKNLHNPRKHMAIVAAAGPAANLAMAIFWALVIWVGVLVSGMSHPVGLGIQYMGLAGVLINMVLMVLNLVPIPPLDGSRVVSGFLPPAWAYQYNRIEPYGLFIVLGLLVTGVLFQFIGPVIMWGRNAVLSLVGLI